MGKIIVSYSIKGDEEYGFTIGSITIAMEKEQHNNQQLMGKKKKKEIEKEEPQKTLLLDQKIIKTIVSLLHRAYGENLRVIKNLNGYSLKIKEPMETTSLTDEFKKYGRFLDEKIVCMMAGESPVCVLSDIVSGLGCRGWKCGECPIYIGPRKECCTTAIGRQIRESE